MAGHDVQYGKHRTRRSFSRIKEVLDLPNLIEIQTDSFKDFLDHGLKEVFEDVFPISNFTDTMELEFVGYEIKEPKYTLEEARIHDASYSAPIFVTFRLINKETGEIKTQEVFFGDFPIMTEMGNLSSSMVVNVLSYLSWSAHQVFTLTIKLIRMVKWVTVQLLSLTVELGWNLKATQKISPTLVSTVLVRFHLRPWFVRLVSQVMMKSLISLVIANWFATLLKKISTRIQWTLVQTKP